MADLRLQISCDELMRLHRQPAVRWDEMLKLLMRHAGNDSDELLSGIEEECGDAECGEVMMCEVRSEE